jgi:hypothetical protein
MLLPSGMARHVVELLPEDRYGNVTQDILWPSSGISVNDALYRVRFLPGKRDLSDVSPSTVCSTIVHQLAGQHYYTLVTSFAPRCPELLPEFNLGATALPSADAQSADIANIATDYLRRRYWRYLAWWRRFGILVAGKVSHLMGRRYSPPDQWRK